MAAQKLKKNSTRAHIGFLILMLLAFLTDFGCGPAWAQKYGRPVIPQNPNLLRQQAFDCYLVGEFEDAADLYKKAIDTGIQQYGQNSAFVADIYYELGTMSLEEGNFSRASRYLPLAVKAKPNSIQARVKLADLYLMQDKVDQAMAEVATALRNNPGSVEAQKELVKLMMARAGNSGDDSAAANLACTWEAFQLKNFSNAVLKNTNTLIAQWQKSIKSGGKNLPKLSVAMLNSAHRAPPPKQETAPAPVQQAVKIKPPQKPTPKPVAKPVVKPRVTRTATKPVTKPVAKSVPKPVSVPAQKVVAKQTPAARPAKRSNGLVPPPPPMVPPPVYAPPPSSIKLETSVQVKKEPKEKKEKKEPPKKVKKPAVPDEPDFILDWAAPKKSKSGGGE
ncbi:MAG: tetratricopeptide repeat protein [Cyanobacteriota/Melainabacteria group bacterium]